MFIWPGCTKKTPQKKNMCMVHANVPDQLPYMSPGQGWFKAVDVWFVCCTVLQYTFWQSTPED